MIGGSFKEYLQNSTLHGFKYVAEGRGFLERLAWVGLIATAFLAASLITVTTMRETSDNPFMTTMEQMPVGEVPFPAVSLEHSQIEQPWDTFASNVLNNAYFDCFEEQTCDRSEKMVSEVGYLVNSHVIKLYKALFREFANLEEHSLFSDEGYISVFCDWVEEFLPGGNALLHNMAVHLERNNLTGSAYSLVRSLAIKTFRLSKAEVREMLVKFAGQQFQDATVSCFDPWQHDLTVVVALYSWFFSQGSVSPKVTLSQLAWFYLIYGYDSANFKDYWETALLEGLDVDFWTPDSNPSAFDVMNFVSPGSYSDMPLGRGANGTVCGGLTKLSGQGTRPFCQEPIKSETCCKIENKMGERYQTVLKIMKGTLQGHTWRMEETSRTSEVTRALGAMGYKSVPADVMFRYYPPLVLGHKFKSGVGGGNSTDPSFLTSFSNEGISYTFNGQPYWDMFKQSDALESFYGELRSTLNGERPVEYPGSSGYSFGLTAVLEMPGKRESLLGRNILVHDPHILPDFSSAPISLRPGYTYTIAVTPSKNTVDAKVDGLPPNDKRCMSARDDHNLTLFRDYSFSSCMYECRLRVASESCGCIPWDFPRWTEELPICHTAGANCFLHKMQNGVPSDR